MDSLFDLLANRIPDEPPEIKLVRQYVRDQFREQALVAVHDQDIVITVRSSALAGSLRARSSALQKMLRDQLGSGYRTRRFVFRIGQADQTG